MGVLLLFLQCSCPRSSLSALQNIALKCRLTVDHGLLTNGYDTVINVKEDCIMRQDLSELIFIIDRSGSMYGLESDTIGGFNRVLEENAKAPGECNITTYFFSDHAELIHDRIPVRGVHPITSKDYIVGGCTALLDTLGTAISKIEHIFARTDESQLPAHVQFVIITDGFENASREYPRDKIRRLILSHQEKDHWDFLFLGADMDAIAEARSYGIPADRAVSTIGDADSVQLAYDAVVCASLDERAAPFAAPRSAKWKKTVESDTARRSGR